MQQRRFAPTFPRAAGRPHPGVRPRGFSSTHAFALAVAALAALAVHGAKPILFRIGLHAKYEPPIFKQAGPVGWHT